MKRSKEAYSAYRHMELERERMTKKDRSQFRDLDIDLHQKVILEYYFFVVR